MIPQWQLRELQKSWGMNIVSAPLQLKGVRRGKQQKQCVLPAAKSWCHTGTAACRTWSQNTCSHGVCQPCVRRIYRGVLVSRGFWIRFGRSVKAHILARVVCEGAHLDPWGDLKTHGIPYWFSLHSLFHQCRETLYHSQGNYFLCPAVFGVFVYNTEDGCLSSSITQGVFLHPGEALWNYFTSCESLFSVLVNPFFHKQLHPALVLVYKAAPRREALLCPRQSPGGIEQQGPLYMLLCHVKPLCYTVSDSLPWRWGCIWS